MAAKIAGHRRSAATAERRHALAARPPGIRRRRHGTGWRYTDADDHPITDPAILARIRSLAIPPAYRDVWISPDPDSHLQALGRDARGRWQYRYHPQWRALRDDDKYRQVLRFARALPGLRARVAADLARRGLPREKVLAAVIRLMERTRFRVGNEAYARENRSYGLTTLRNRHVEISGTTLRFAFRGKHGIRQEAVLANRSLARIVGRCRDLPGQLLFQYLDAEGVRHAIGSREVNAYLQEVTGEDFTAKDFRTWAGTWLAAVALAEMPAPGNQRGRRSAMLRAAEAVSRRLGNTPSICRKCYIHPAVFEAFEDGGLAALPGLIEGCRATPADGLGAEEAAVLEFLEHRPVAAADQRDAATDRAA
jgi:DNA topoisomerase-1